MSTATCHSQHPPWTPHAAIGIATVLLALSVAVGQLAANETDLRDLQYELTVRDELAKDQWLRPLNLIVSVKDRVATLKGPVPSRELARRAVETVKRMPEIREVRDKMMVQFEDARLFMPLAWPVPAVMPPALAPAMVKPKLPPPLIEPTGPEPKPGQNQTIGVWRPVKPDLTAPPTTGVALLPWLPAQLGLGEPVSRAKAETAPKNPEPPAAAAIGSAVQSLVRGEDRYRRLRYEVIDGEVFLSGVVDRWADIQELARALARIPGVDAVILRGVKTGLPHN